VRWIRGGAAGGSTNGSGSEATRQTSERPFIYQVILSDGSGHESSAYIYKSPCRLVGLKADGADSQAPKPDDEPTGPFVTKTIEISNYRIHIGDFEYGGSKCKEQFEIREGDERRTSKPALFKIPESHIQSPKLHVAFMCGHDEDNPAVEVEINGKSIYLRSDGTSMSFDIQDDVLLIGGSTNNLVVHSPSDGSGGLDDLEIQGFSISYKTR
jgi:hypothetical protein